MANVEMSFVHYDNPGYFGSEHAVVVKDIVRDGKGNVVGVEIHDPWGGKAYTITHEDFAKYFFGEIIVFPKDFKFPDQLIRK